jgi:hypothetical protein
MSDSLKNKVIDKQLRIKLLKIFLNKCVNTIGLTLERRRQLGNSEVGINGRYCAGYVKIWGFGKSNVGLGISELPGLTGK